MQQVSPLGGRVMPQRVRALEPMNKQRLDVFDAVQPVDWVEAVGSSDLVVEREIGFVSEHMRRQRRVH